MFFFNSEYIILESPMNSSEYNTFPYLRKQIQELTFAIETRFRNTFYIMQYNGLTDF